MAVGGVLLTLVAAFALPSFFRARTTSAMNACVNNLRLIDGATQTWALENRKTTNDAPTWEDLRPFVSRDGQLPRCPHGGAYTLGRLDKKPTCSYPGDALPSDTSP